VSPLSHAIPIQIGINTYTKADLVNIQLVQHLGLKPCQNTNLPILQAINQQNLPTYRAYNLRLKLTDAYGTRRTSLRPYLAVDQDQGDSRVLLSIPALTELKILVNCEAYNWEYKAEKTTIKIDLYQRFRKHTQRAKIYALVKVNHLL
jgi:hypothetical protein